MKLAAWMPTRLSLEHLIDAGSEHLYITTYEYNNNTGRASHCVGD